MPATQALATFVADTAYADLPPSLTAECKIATLDVFAAAFGGQGLNQEERPRYRVTVGGKVPQ